MQDDSFNTQTVFSLVSVQVMFAGAHDHVVFHPARRSVGKMTCLHLRNHDTMEKWEEGDRGSR